MYIKLYKLFVCFIEQRVSALTVSTLVGLAVMLYAILNLVPTPVLLGIFLYMGVSATAGIQLLERVVLFFKPIKHHPNVPYVKKVTFLVCFYESATEMYHCHLRIFHDTLKIEKWQSAK